MSSNAKIHASLVLAEQLKLITMVLTGSLNVWEQETSFLLRMTCAYILEKNM
jgi:hypothetical protein